MTLFSTLAGRLFDLPPRQTARVVIEQGLAVPMRDGVMLVADRVYAPGSEAAPVVLIRSPYGRDALFGLIARLFAERGLQVVIQSCRGTFGSGGTFDPMRQEEADGVDTINWVRSQPWFTGRLFTYGGSYLGFTQWAVAKPARDKIDGMALSVTLSNFRDETLAFGGFTLEGALAWTSMMMQMPPPRGLSGLVQALSTSRRAAQLARIHNHLPLKDLDHLATGKRASWWQDWVGHGEPDDPWWSAVDHSAAVADVTAPTTMLGGWRDIFLPHQIRDFEAMQAAGREVWLTVGPWTHAQMGGMFEGVKQALALFGAVGGDKQLASRNRVRLYVGGAETWREYSTWPPPGVRERRLYLQPEGGLAPAAAEITTAVSRYAYDPADPTPSMHGPRLFGAAKRPDMTALKRRADVLSFSTPPLDEDLEVIGPVRAQLYVRSTLNHTDFYVCVCDVDRAGRVLHVVDGYLRLRPGQPIADSDNVRSIVLECWPTAYRFSRGNRICLLVASGAHPRFARNLGTGEPLGEGVRMLVAHQEILHDREHPSAVLLTVL